VRPARETVIIVTKELPGKNEFCIVKHYNMHTVKLTTQDFKDKVFDYTTEQEWKYKGTLPAIIDFYADWCGPCKMVAPVLEELALEYEGKLVIYKVDTEAEMELSAVFGIQSIPTFLFIPAEGQPMMQPGAFPKKVFKEVIEERLINSVPTS
jgi:thioredoxin